MMLGGLELSLLDHVTFGNPFNSEVIGSKKGVPPLLQSCPDPTLLRSVTSITSKRWHMYALFETPSRINSIVSSCYTNPRKAQIRKKSNPLLLQETYQANHLDSFILVSSSISNEYCKNLDTSKKNLKNRHSAHTSTATQI
jgi:hypothetical protein